MVLLQEFGQLDAMPASTNPGANSSKWIILHFGVEWGVESLIGASTESGVKISVKWGGKSVRSAFIDASTDSRVELGVKPFVESFLDARIDSGVKLGVR